MDKLNLLFITKDFRQHVERSSYYLSEELGKLTNLVMWSRDGGIRDILEEIDMVPDFILLNDFKPDYSPFIRRLRDSPVPYGVIMHDLQYKIQQRKAFITSENVRHIFSIYRDPFYRYYPEFSDRMIWLPHHVPLGIFKDYGHEKTIDWLMTGAMIPHIYPLRCQMYEGLKRRSGFTHIAHPGYKNVVEDDPGIYTGEKYARLINQAKIFLTCDSVERFPVLKYYEAAACNTLLLAGGNKELNDLGFIDGETFISVNRDNFMEKADYYAGHEEERKRIAARGMEMVSRRHSTEQRAKELVETIKNNILGTL